MLSEFKEGDTVVRTSNGRKAMVTFVYSNDQMQIMYLDDEGRRVYDVRCDNFVSSKEWEKQKHKPYEPKSETIEEFKSYIAERTIILEGEKYAFIFQGRFDGRIIRGLIDRCFLKKAGRWGDVLKNKGFDWSRWCEEEREKGNRRSLHCNVTVYQLLGDVENFRW